MLVELYFRIHNTKGDLFIKMMLMGVIAFILSAIKHIKRRSPFWIVANQFKGIVMCTSQLILYLIKRRLVVRCHGEPPVIKDLQ
jgi:hypothetical protein